MKVPPELAALPRWVRWRDEEGRKIPLHPTENRRASVSDPATWGSFADARAHVTEHEASGLGFVFTAEDGIVGLDFDGCADRESGKIREDVARLIAELGTYAEVSPSWTGVHAIGRGSLNGHGLNGHGLNRKKDRGVEIYSTGRYFTFTGWRLPSAPREIRDIQEPLDRLLTDLAPPTPAPAPRPSRESRGEDYSRTVERARAYVSHRPPAISGQGGHAATFTVAVDLAYGFALDEGDALEILREFSSRCEPPWSERELAHKVSQAMKVESRSEGPLGYLRDAPSPKATKAGGRKAVTPATGGAESEKAETKRGVYDVPGILARSSSGGPRYATGLDPLDEKLTPRADSTKRGLPLGRAVCINGAPHEGKSVLLCQLSLAMARHGLRVVMLADDEPREDAAERIAQGLGFRHAELNPEYPATLEKVREAVAGLDLAIFPDEEEEGPRPTIEDAAALLLGTPNEKGHVLALDSIHAARSAAEREEDPPRAQIQARMNAIRALRRKGVLVLFTSEVNRGSYASKDPANRTSPIASGAESRAIEFGADVLLFLSEGEGGTVRVEIPKNRAGRKKGTFFVRLHEGAARFEGVTEEAIEAEREGKRDEKLFAIEDKILSVLRDAPGGVSGRAIEGEAMARANDVRAALKSAVEKGKVLRFSGGRGGGFRYRLPGAGGES